VIATILANYIMNEGFGLSVRNTLGTLGAAQLGKNLICISFYVV